jgi:hypothetical protein
MVEKKLDDDIKARKTTLTQRLVHTGKVSLAKISSLEQHILYTNAGKQLS